MHRYGLRARFTMLAMFLASLWGRSLANHRSRAGLS